MKRQSVTTIIAGCLLLGCLAASVGVSQKVDAERGDVTLQDVLYIPSPNTIKRLSLGYNGLLADIYWTRAVQYFGSKHHEHSLNYKLLAPLLDITTTLDPHLIVAYEFGSIFLSQKPPEGAGDPQAAVRLVQRGIRENPKAWRLWYHLGFIYWQELHDSKTASECFQRGSEVPGALPWMKVMAAALAQNAGEAETAHYLWTNILNSTTDPDIRANAEKRLIALRVDREVTILQEYVDRFEQAKGHAPNNWFEMIQAGMLRSIPIDPVGYPYELVNGRVQVAKPDLLPFITKGLPPGNESNVLPKMP